MTDLQTLYFEKPHKLIHEFKNGAVIDTNVLTLYLIGIIDKRKNTHYLQQLSYKPYDYSTFILFKENMKIERVIVTPNILTEFFNIVENKLGKTFFPKYLDEMKPFLEKLHEKYYCKDKIINLPKFGDFDFTDLSIHLASNEEYPIITSDTSLHSFCKSCKKHERNLVIHFNEIKNLRLLTAR